MYCKTSDNLNLYYEIQGNSSATETLVLLNGLTQSTLSWGLVVPYFKTNYRIILLDFIFQGQSDKTGEWRTFAQHARDVKAVLDKENITKVNLLGLSYGSLVAQHFAVIYPAYLSRLVLVSTFAHKTPYYEAVELSWWRALEIGGYNLLLDIMLPSVLSEGYFANPLIPINVMKEMRKDSNQNSEAILNLMRATKERDDYRTELKKINCPALIIQGEKDLLLPVHLANEVHLNIKHSQFIVIKNAGHTLNLEHVPEVSSLISNFLNQVK
ncbi:MAG: alpha/beta hydrolase [Flavobacteriia bacterium]|nr:alpha/beta hydrolase [Flavobacteriia bacterium]